MPSPHTLQPPARSRTPERLTEVLEDAADAALLAPSVHNTQPWRIVLHPDRLDLEADRSRQLTVLDPAGRELVQSVGAALLNARVAVAAAGRAVAVERLPSPDEPDLLAVVRPVDGDPDAALAELGPAVAKRRTNRRRFADAPVPDDVLSALARDAAAEGAGLVPVARADSLELLARLTQQADREQNADAAYRAELRRWTHRRPADRDGIPDSAVPHVDGRQSDALPLRDFDTAGSGALPADTHSGTEQTLVLLTTRGDEPMDWLRSGEALERVLLRLTALRWVASPLTQIVEVPQTRAQLRSALAPHAHPQFVVRIGRAASTERTPRRARSAVVENSSRPDPPETPRRSGASGWPVGPAVGPSGRRPVPDGRGGTTWI
ncbi:nitroreductase [Geodermatophilus sp. TF02-6]|uniref:Acg family FMN-binding oxidoreductase n=1 Tax=Geodermatophilus sp. TF02-6 TaxID=2250575 RepID=UPI000DEA4B5B|nr:nitroreductase [Geodermatophilus sp. TF02-6]RBY82390.1 nitroreductase [Geodermatophilus sp. TF02-6]